MNRSQRSVEKEPSTKAAPEPPKRELSSGKVLLIAIGAFVVILGSIFLLNSYLEEQDLIPKSDLASTVAEVPVFRFLLGDQQTPPNTDPRVGKVKVETPDGGYTGIEKFCDGSTLVYQDSNWSRAEDSISTQPNDSECLPVLNR